MTIQFNSQLLMQDFDATCKRKKISLYRAAARVKVQASTLSSIRTGTVKDITVTSLARMLDFMGNSDINKYIYDDGE